MRARAILSTALAFASACSGSPEPTRPSETIGTAPPRAASAPGVETSLDAAPWAERVGLEQAIAAGDRRFAPRADEGGPVLETPGAIVASFTASGAHLTLGAHEVTLRASAMGRDGRLVPLESASSPAIAGVEVRTVRGAFVDEWWRSLPSGLEQGITIAERPTGSGPLAIRVAVHGALSARGLSGDAVELRDANDVLVATYAHLVVLDADGARVPGSMSVEGSEIALTIEDASARYPLVVDPLVIVQEAALVAPDASSGDAYGGSVSLSSDGSRALVGAPGDDTIGGTDAGSARVLLRTGATWTQEAVLLAPDGAVSDGLGSSVALSSDGTRAVIGAAFDDTARGVDAGSARVFVRTGTTWAQEATLVPALGLAGDWFGFSVAVTADGSRALVGASHEAGGLPVNEGSAHVFVRAGATWTEETSLAPVVTPIPPGFGASVALTADGSRALVGANLELIDTDSEDGAAHVFVRAGTSWAEEAIMIGPFTGTCCESFGASVSLSSDGSRALIGAPLRNYRTLIAMGTAYVFARTGTSWALEGTLVVPDAVLRDHLGAGVSLSADGTRALVGMPLDDTGRGVNAGSARIFLLNGGAWTYEGTLEAPDGVAFENFAAVVAISGDGTRALLGDPAHGGSGFARVFTLNRAPTGALCDGDTVCASGFCTDGVCCGVRCAGGSGDCQACSAALTGGLDGTCGVLAASTVCRAAADVCDVPEACNGMSNTCPADALAPSSTVCRSSATACDAAEACTGSSVVCPPNVPAASGTTCRAVAGGCDLEEVCDGTSFTCPAEVVIAANSVCRGAVGVCDAIEVCDGISSACPGDALVPAGSVCRSNAGTCDVEEACDGVSPTCPTNVFLVAGVVCRSASTECDLPETCTGLAGGCPADVFMPASTACGPASTDVCDLPDHCAGTSANCPARYLSGVECRASAGPCDAEEICSGDAPTCPPDVLESAAMVCRPSINLSCDPPEVCDGVSPACPTDAITMMCSAVDAGASDAGAGDGGASDAGSTRDGGESGVDAGPPAAATGCACRASGGSSSDRWIPVLALAVVLIQLRLDRKRLRGSRR